MHQQSQRPERGATLNNQAAHCPASSVKWCCCSGPSDGSMSSAAGRQGEAEGVGPSSPHLDIFEPRPALSGGLEAVLGQEAESLGSMSGPELLTHMADGMPTGKTWLRGGESLPAPSCTQGPCKSRSVRKISCTLDADVVSISYNRKVSPAIYCPIMYCTQLLLTLS